MLLIVFFALFAGCIGLWSAGASAWLVFALALAAWIAFTLLLYPKIRTYKVAMGIDDRLNAAEATGWEWLSLKLAGFRVLILSFLTSMLPFLGSAAEWLNGQKLDFFFDPADPKRQQTVMFVIGAIVFAVPPLMQWLHSTTAAKAAVSAPHASATTPKGS